MEHIDEFSQVIHTFYRLSNTASTLQFLLSGILKVFNHSLRFSSSKLVLKNVNSHPFITARLKGSREYIFRKGGTRILTFVERNCINAMKEKYTLRHAVVPIIFGEASGVFLGERSFPHLRPFSPDEKKKINMLIEGASLVMRNFQLCEEQQRILVGSIKALSKFLSNSIPTSSIHAEIMSRFIRELSRELRLTKSEFGSLEYAAMLHDAGKVNVPVDILSKVAPLTKHEYSLIKSHPEKGVQLIRNLHLLKPVLPIILYHHERYDGSGYPSGLKKKQIPLGARILAVVDAFDAMVFGRPYKKKISLDDAIREFKAKRGVQFDPDIVDAFLKVLNKPCIRKYLNRLT